MNNEELAKLLRKIVREEIEVEAKRTHSDIHMLKLEVRTGLSKVTDKVKDVEISQTRLEKKIDQQGEQIMDAIADTATEIFKEQDQRISHIEEHLGLENPKKN